MVYVFGSHHFHTFCFLLFLFHLYFHFFTSSRSFTVTLRFTVWVCFAYKKSQDLFYCFLLAVWYVYWLNYFWLGIMVSAYFFKPADRWINSRVVTVTCQKTFKESFERYTDEYGIINISFQKTVCNKSFIYFEIQVLMNKFVFVLITIMKRSKS